MLPSLCQQKPIQCGNQVQQHWKRTTVHTTWIRKIPLLQFCMQSQNNHSPQTTGSYIQKRCSNTITLTSRHPLMHTSIIQYMHNIQAWPRALYCITDWPSQQNHCENKDQEIPSMKLSINAINTFTLISEYLSTYKIWDATQNNEYLQVLTTYIIIS